MCVVEVASKDHIQYHQVLSWKSGNYKNWYYWRTEVGDTLHCLLYIGLDNVSDQSTSLNMLESFCFVRSSANKLNFSSGAETAPASPFLLANTHCDLLNCNLKLEHILFVLSWQFSNHRTPCSVLGERGWSNYMNQLGVEGTNSNHNTQILSLPLTISLIATIHSWMWRQQWSFLFAFEECESLLVGSKCITAAPKIYLWYPALRSITTWGINQSGFGRHKSNKPVRNSKSKDWLV